MGLVVSHKFVSAKPDSADLTLVNPTNWNALHVVTDNSRSAFNIDYLFTITLSGALTGGISNTVTISPVPIGLNGTDSKHMIYISGGIGSAEAVMITGGTARSGDASGTLTFTPANNHAGSWTITSATGGIAEAQQYVLSTFGGGMVTIVPGNWPIYGSIFFQDNMVFAGYGVASVLLPQTTNTVVFQGNVPVKANEEHTLNSDDIFFRDFTIDAIAFGTGVNNCGGIIGTNLTTSTECWSYMNVQINNIDFNNVFNAITFYRIYGLSILNCRLWNNSKILISDSSTFNNVTYINVNTIIDKLWYNWHPMNNPTGAQVVMTTSVITIIGGEVTKITDSYFALRGATSNTGTAYGITCLGGEDYYVARCTFLQAWSAIAFGSISNGGTTFYASFITVTECSIDQIWGPAVVVNPGTGVGPNQQSAHIQIVDNEITDSIRTQGGLAFFILLFDYTRQVLISGNLFRGIFGSTSQIGIGINSNISDVIFGPNIWENGDGSGDQSGIYPIGVFLSNNVSRVYGLENNLFSANGWGSGVLDSNSSGASTANLVVPAHRRFYTVSGTTNITGIIYNGQINDVITLLFTGALTVVKGGNLKLSANFVTTGAAIDALTFMWDGTNAVELSRSAN